MIPPPTSTPVSSPAAIDAASMPVLDCPRRALEAPAADPLSAPWAELPAFRFLETVSGQPPRRPAWVKAAWSPGEPAQLRLLFFSAGEGADDETPETAGLHLDPVGDLDGFFEIAVDRAGAASAAVFRRCRSGYKRNSGWRCDGMRHVVKRHPGGWAAELSIPFSGLGSVAPHPCWRANFFRIAAPAGKPRELCAWSPTRSGLLQQPSRFGLLQFME